MTPRAIRAGRAGRRSRTSRRSRSSSGGAYSTLTGYRIAGVERRRPAGRRDPVRLRRFPAFSTSAAARSPPRWSSRPPRAGSPRSSSPPACSRNEGGEHLSQEAREIVADFQTSRRDPGIAFLQGVSYSRENLSPADLQLIEARANVATDVARLFNVPVAMIGASPSGNASALLYSNLSQQLAMLVSSAVAPHLRTIEATLSDAYPRGTSVAFDVQTFLRSDPQAAADYVIALLGAGLVDVAEGAVHARHPDRRRRPSADLTPGRV